MVVEKNWVKGQMSEQNRIRINILVKAKGEKDYRRMELGTFREGNITVSILDEAGNNIHKEKDLQHPNQNALTITMKDLPNGTYFMEVDDGFFIQVKEIQL
ncbi:MAG: hypothetical protein AAGC85_23310 [Bacteroidota bacterium]